MNKSLGMAAFVLGLAAIGWVGFGYLGGSHALALAMTALIAAFYLMGAVELQRFHRATSELDAALASIPPDLQHLGDWLGQLPAALQNAVRLRIEGERAGLPAPMMTPYLVGLLVLLGMLGTFLGMVVTLDGAVMALETTTDLPTIRAALSAPVKGLGLAFGTSVAGVAASAMLGLMSATCRRERLLVSRLLDTRVATSLRRFSLAQRREETFDSLQSQARVIPEVVGQLQLALQSMMTQLEQQSQAQHDRLLAGQQAFFRDARTVHAELASSVEQSLKASLADTARAAGATIEPMAEALLAGIARSAASLHERTADTVRMQLDAISARFDTTVTTVQAELAGQMGQLAQTASEAPRAAAEMMGQLRQRLSDSLAQDNAVLEERRHLMETLNALLDAIRHAAGEQRAAIDAMVASSAAVLQQVSAKVSDSIGAQSAGLAAVAAQVTGSAVEVASLGEAFGFGVQQFSASSDALITTLTRIEGALNQSVARSDEQLAYYVAQAREIIDLSMLSQKHIVEDLQQLADGQATLAGRQAALASEVA
ncbi:hypothetical protein HLB44_11350 [Aquincola sp. S2]|uniref:DUF802 domain-containing protein n=1 Tax=Pseudaquabacterium terrae TaxID=2732868 RepID=A0ABX2EG21_9BURK|nr:hypothetical protein [Aquabacterium terrae]NRF67580.1 hypothetical protein [Aquabacterium terrae]